MTITYYDSQLLFGPDATSRPPVPNGTPEPARWTDCDDSDLDQCFSLLCQGYHVRVNNHHGIKHFRNYLMHHFQYVKAAGGCVTSPQGNCLLIHREGKWDLPKGMVEAGETLAAAALREVQEETSIPYVEIDRLLTKTYHIYDKYGGWHLKQTSWYAMRTDRQYALAPQTEEGISEARWLTSACARERLDNSFASLRQLARFINCNTR